MKPNNIVTVGNKGEKVRSDCFLTLELTEKGGRQISIASKVDALFGVEIRKLIDDILDFYEIENLKLDFEDTGALPFVQAARLEYAIKCVKETDKDFLLEMNSQNLYSTIKDRFRFSRLYLPGNTPSMMLNAGVHNPNGIILDLEDAVSYSKKGEAQILVRNALREVDFYGAERMVRINQYPRGLEDLKYILPNNVNLILVPKCESAEQVEQIENYIQKFKSQNNIKSTTWLMPIIESALGIENAFQIATASPNIVALAIGLEDFTADLGVKRTNEGTESLYARMRLVNACKAAGIQPIDSVFSDISDMEALAVNVKTSKSLGFEGMGCIHPRQIMVIHQNFAPLPEEIEKAKTIVLAFNEAEQKGLGVVSLGTKMIDAPVVKRAKTTIKLAVDLGILDTNWDKD